MNFSTKKAFLFLGFGILMSFMMVSCLEGDKERLKHVNALYQQSQENKDYITSLVALNEIVLLDTQVGAYHDSLARIYLAQGNYDAALKFGQKVLKQQPDYQKMIELVGLSHEALGNMEEAIQKFASLFLRTGQLKYQYEIGKIELGRQNYVAADSVLNFITNDTSGDKSTVDMQSASGKVSKIATTAAANYLQGVLLVEREQKFKLGAKKMRAALAIEPNFELAIQYLQELERYQQMMAYPRR